MKQLRIGKWMLILAAFVAVLALSVDSVADDTLRVDLSVMDVVERSRTKETKGEVLKWPFFSIYRDAVTVTCELDMSVSGGSDEEIPCTLEWYFIAERRVDKDTKPTDVIAQSGRKKLLLQGRETVEITTKNKFVYAKIVVNEYKAYGNRNIDERLYVEGDSYIGYIVLVTENDRIIAKTASHEWLLDDEHIARCRQGAETLEP